jgi:hypothetical protein
MAAGGRERRERRERGDPGCTHERAGPKIDELAAYPVAASSSRARPPGC